MGLECVQITSSCPQQPRDVVRGAVAQPGTHDLRWPAAQHAQSMKVFVFGHEHAAVVAGKLPNHGISGAASSEETNVERIGKEIRQQGHQLFGQLFVEEQAHEITPGGRESDAPARPHTTDTLGCLPASVAQSPE
jgi:hypothetical protein